MTLDRRLLERGALPLLVALAVLAPLAIHWAAGRTLVWFDTLRLYAPQRWIVDEALRAFRLPLWNPFVAAGTPLFAEGIHGVLHPVSIATAWMGTAWSADLMIGGHVLFAGIGAALLARDLGASRSAAALAGVSFGTSGFVLSMAGNLVFLAGAGSLPFCVAGLRRAAVGRAARDLAFGVLATALLAFTGDAQVLMVGGVLSLALAWEAAGGKGALRAALIGALGLAVAGVQLIPTASHLAQTGRTASAVATQATEWSLEPWRLPELVAPGLLAGPEQVAYPVFEALAGPGHWPPDAAPRPFAASVFVGLLPLAFAVAGALEGRLGRFLGGAALAFAWMALGDLLGAQQLLRHVPIWGSFRYAEKLLGPLTLALALLAARGADASSERGEVARRALVAGGLLAVAAFAAGRFTVGTAEPMVRALVDGRVTLGAWHLGAGLALLVAWGTLRARLPPGARTAALALVTWGTLAAASPAALRAGDPAMRLRAEGTKLVAPAPGPRVLTPYDYDFPAAPGVDFIDQSGRMHALLAVPAYNVRLRVDQLTEYSGLIPRRLAAVQSNFGPRWPRAARRFGVTHVLLPPPWTEEQRILHAITTENATRVGTAPGAIEIWATPHRDWASFPEELAVVEDEETALAELRAVFQEGSRAAVVETDGPISVGRGRVLSVDRALDSLRIDAESEGDATLVVADAWWPGWEARVDGQRVPIHPADVLVRAVPWPAGRHLLEMRYRPPEVAAGLVVTLLAIVALLAWILAIRRGSSGVARAASAADPAGPGPAQA